MKHIRTERQTTPIGQEVEVEWFFGSPDEAELLLRRDSGQIHIRDGAWDWSAQVPADDPTGKLTLYGTDDPEESIAKTIDEEAEPEKWEAHIREHERRMDVDALSDFFSGEIEFSPVKDV